MFMTIRECPPRPRHRIPRASLVLLAVMPPSWAHADTLNTAVGAHAENLILRLLIQLVVILSVTRLVVWLAHRLGQTAVAGEILAGILLGPSALGALAPGVMSRVFDSSTSTIFIGIAQLGLVLLMFQIGLEFEFSRLLGSNRRAVGILCTTSVLVPFGLGWLTAPHFFAIGVGPFASPMAFRLVFAIAMAITAIPILGRIFMELGLSHTRTAALTIGAAAIEDVVGWLLLGAVTLYVRAALSPAFMVGRGLGLALYVLVMLKFVGPWLRRWLRGRIESCGGQLESRDVGYILIVLLISACITSSLGVFAIIGGFVVGAALHQERPFVEAWRKCVSPLVYSLFLPIFFAYTGLRTDVGSLHGAQHWLMFAGVLTVAFSGKLVGGYLGGRLIGESHRSSVVLGVCMNTRALMELIVLNIGLDLGVLSRALFTMLVLMAIISTFMATPLIRILMRTQTSRLDRPAEASSSAA